MGKRNRTLNKSRRESERETDELMRWLADQGAVESVQYDEDTGRPYRAFTIDLTKEGGK